jgi:hypothetical protein
MTFANQYREFVTQLLVKAFANVNGRRPLHIADGQFLAEDISKNDHLPVCKTSYKKKQCTALSAGALTV